jgi:hypothetical protein
MLVGKSLFSHRRLCALRDWGRWQVEEHDDAPRSTPRAFQSIFEHRDRKHRAARPDECVEVELDSRLALSNGLGALASAPGATGGDPHSGVAGFGGGFDYRTNKEHSCC